MAEHRTPRSPGHGPAGGAQHGADDPGRSPDPAIRELVAALAAVRPAPAPDPRFRAELRAQLVAVTPRLVAEGPLAAPAPAPGRWRRVLARLRIGRKLRIATAVLAVAAVGLSGTVWLSRGALPGDALYGLKRASESARFSLTSGSVARAKDLLAFAKTRADEVADLLGHAGASGPGPAADGIGAATASLVRSTLDAADDDLRQASRLLGAQAVRQHSAAPARVLAAWAPAQLGRLNAVTARIPAGPLHARAAESAALVTAAFVRAQQLAAQAGCTCSGRAAGDQLGPVPCSTCEEARTGTGAPGRLPAGSAPARPGSSASAGRGGSAPGGTAPGAAVGGRPSPAAPAPTPGGTAPARTLPAVPLPTIPGLGKPSPGGGCGSTLSLGPILIGGGSCGIGVHI
jgi:hypothetical protein